MAENVIAGSPPQPLPEGEGQEKLSDASPKSASLPFGDPAEAIVAGHICLDVIPTLTGSAIEFVPGKLVEAGGVTTATGGAVSNTGLALHRLGVGTRLAGKIGADLFGDAILKILDANGPGLADGMVVSESEPTSYSIILSPPGADRMFIHAPGCNATFDEHDIPTGAFDGARLFHFGYPPLMERTYRNGGASLAAIFEGAKAAGITTSLDMSMPDMAGPAGQVNWRDLLGRVLPFVDIFVPSLDEMMVMLFAGSPPQPSLRAGTEACSHRERESELGEAANAFPKSESPSPVAPRKGAFGPTTPGRGWGGEPANACSACEENLRLIAAELLSMGAKIVVLKAGHRGLYLRSASEAALAHMGRSMPDDLPSWADRELWSPCFAVDVVGTTGSGDATIAGFLMGVLRGMTPEQSMTAACAVGACSVEAADALGGIRTWPKTSARIEAGWPRLSVGVELNGWQWDEQNGVWRGPCDCVV